MRQKNIMMGHAGPETKKQQITRPDKDNKSSVTVGG
jgi:hypothetical protein